MEPNFTPNEQEIKIINEVMRGIKDNYNIKVISLNEFEVFVPLTVEWKTNFKQGNGGYAWGSNGNRIHCRENPPRKGGKVWLTRCTNMIAFYELIFHEVYELLIGGGHEKIIPEERHYIEEKFNVKLDEWLPIEEEIIRVLYPIDKESLENSFKNCGNETKEWHQIEQRAKQLGL